MSSIVFVDSRLTDYETLLASLSGADHEVILLDPDRDGLAQMLTALDGRSGIEAIHLLGHGSSGALQVGATTLDRANLAGYQTQLAELGGHLALDGDLLLYGCNVAQGEAGLAFIEQIAVLTGADVAASDDLTGAAGLGGNWELEASTGDAVQGLKNLAYGSLLAEGDAQWTYNNQGLVADTSIPYRLTVHVLFGHASPTGPWGDLTVTVTWTDSATELGTSTHTVKDSESATKDHYFAYEPSEATGNGLDGHTVTATLTWSPAGSLNTTYSNGGAIKTHSYDLADWGLGNVAPVASDGSGIGSEDVTLNDSVTASDPDSDPLTYELVGGNPANANSFSFTTSNGAYSFTPTANWFGTTSFQFKVKDTSNVYSATKTETITIQPVDDSVISSAISAQNFDAQGNWNFYVGGNFSDADGGITLTATKGDNSALPGWLTFAGGSFTGNPPDSVKGTTIALKVTGDGPGSAGEPNSQTFNLVLGSGVNDIPTSADDTNTVLEDGTLSYSSADFAFIDADNNPVDTLTSITVITKPTTGSLFVDADSSGVMDGSETALDNSGTVSTADLAKLRFTPVADTNGAGAYSWTFKVNDGHADSTATYTQTVNITPVNDAPVLTAGGSDLTGIDENYTGDGQTVASIFASRTDVDTVTNGAGEGVGQGIAIYSTTVNGPSTGGKWQYKVDAGSWTDVGVVADGSALLLKSTDSIRFLPDGNNANATASFNYYAWDQATGAAGNKVDVSTRGTTTAFSLISDPVAITVSDVNDAPTIAKPGAQTVAEDASIGITGVSFDDVDINPTYRLDSDATNDVMSVVLTVTNGTITLAGTTGLTVTAGADASASMTIEGTRDALNTAVATLTYTPTANYNGADTLAITVNDKGNVGGAALQTTDSVAITVTPVNDAPVLTDTGTDPLTGITENNVTDVGQTVASFLATRTDIDTTIGSTTHGTDNGRLQGVAIYSTTVNGPSTGGHWEYKVDTGAWTAFGARTVSDVSTTSALLLKSDDFIRFVPDAKNGQTASFDYYGWDQSAGTTAGSRVNVTNRGLTTPYSTASDSANITIDDVNDAPTISTPSAKSVFEDNPLTINDLSFDDVDINTTWRADGNGSGGSDPANNTVEITLSVAHGVLALSGTAGITFQNSTAQSQATLTFQGTLVDVNAAVLGLQYTPDLNYNRYLSTTDLPDVLNISISDLQNVEGVGDAANPALTATSQFNITVNPVNDAPVLENAGASAPLLTTVNENVGNDNGAANDDGNAATLNDGDDDATLNGNNGGNLISDLIRAVDGTNPTDNAHSVVTDVDFFTGGVANGNPNEAQDHGVAIYGLSNTGPADGGVWQFSINGGSSWSNITTANMTGDVATATALLLRSTDKIRFVPDTFNGTTATVSYVLWDGLLVNATGQQGTYVSIAARGGTTNFSTASDVATLTVTHVNDNPLLDLDSTSASSVSTGYTTTFLPRGNEVQVIGANVSITDVDKLDRTDVAQRDTITQATVSITGGALDNLFGTTYETLSVKASGAGTATITSYVGSLGSIAITGNGTTTVTFNGAGTWADYQAALQKVYYNNANSNATVGDRTISVTVKDGGTTTAADDKLDSNVATTTILMPWAPVIDLDGSLSSGRDHSTTFTEGLAAADGTKVAIAYPNASLTDQDGNIASLTITLTNPLDTTAESLSVDASVLSTLTAQSISISYGANNHSVTFTGNKDATYFQLALRAVKYLNTSQNPNVTQRVVTVAATDVAGNPSVSAQTTINIVPTNDAPLIGDGDRAATLLEGGLYPLTSGSGNDLNPSDVDDSVPTLKYVVTSTAALHGVLFLDTNGNGIVDTGETLTAITNPVTAGALNAFTQGDVTAGLVKYQHDSSNTTSASVAFRLEDGMENGVTAPTGTFDFTVTPVNDAPTLTATSTNPTFTEGGAAATPFSAVTVGTDETGQNITQIKLTVTGLADGAAEELVIDGVVVALQAIVTTAITGGTQGGFSYAIAVASSTATVTLTKTDTAANWQTLVTALAYQNTSTAPTAANRVITLTEIKDDGTTVNGGVDTTTLALASTVTVVGVDSAPVLATNTGVTLANGALATLTTTELNTTDSDTSASALIYTVGTATTKGTLFRDGNSSNAADAGEALTAGSTFTQADLAASFIKYRHDGADNLADSFGFTVKDATTTLPSATFNLTITGATSTTPTVSGGGSTTANSTDGSDPLFSGVVITPAPGETVKSLRLTLTGVTNGDKEILTLNGQTIPMTVGTITVGDITYTVVDNGGGSFTVTITDTTDPGWDGTAASDIVNGARYTNTAVPPTAGVRSATLDQITDWTSGGLTGTPTPVAIASTVTLATSTDLFTLAAAEAAVPAPTAPNDVITTLNFTVTGVKDGTNEFIKINGHEVPMVAGTSTVDGVTYTVTESPAASGNFTVAVTNPSGWTEVQAEALLDAATYSDNTNPATAGDRVVTLASVVEAQTGGGTPTPAGTPTLITTPALTTTVPFTDGGITYPTPQTGTPLAAATVTVTADSTVDSLTLTVDGVKDGATETLTIDGQIIPLVTTTTPLGLFTGTDGVKFFVSVTVDASGKATVLVDTPDAPNADATNFTEAQAQAVVRGVIYTNNANPPTGGTRDVALTQIKEETGSGSPTAGTPSIVTPPATTGAVVVPSIDVFASDKTIPALGGGDTVDSLTVGVSGIKDGNKEIININGQPIPLVAGTTTDANGYTYTVVIDANGNATVTLGTPSPVANLTAAQANAIIDGISYTDKANPPTPGARDVTVNGLVKASDAVPPELTPLAISGIETNIPVGTVTNTVPVITTNTGLAVSEGQTVTLAAAQLAATDAQQAAAGLVFKQVALPNHGTLFRDTNGNGLVNTGEALALNGSFTQLELTNGSIKYRHDSSETTVDQLSFTVSDGIASTTTMPLVMTISRVNDVPTLTASASNPTFTENGAAVTLFAAATATSGDTLGTPQKFVGLTLTVSNLHDGAAEQLLIDGQTVALTHGTNGTSTANSVTYAVAVTGSTATVTLGHAGLIAAEIKTLLEAISYSHSSDHPTAGVRNISITALKDDGGNVSPSLDTAVLALTSSVTVNPVNDAPTLTGTNFTVIEGGSFTLSTSQLAASDVDSAASSFVYSLSTAPTAGTLFVDANGNAQLDAGEALALNGTFTQSDLTSGKVRYQHDGNETGDSFAVLVSDGLLPSSAATLTVTRTPVNDAPTLNNLNTDVLSYPANSGLCTVDVGANATATDPDSSNFSGGTLRVSISLNNDGAHDVLAIQNVGTGAGQIGVSGANVSYAGTTIGTFAGGTGANDLVVTLNADATPTATSALLKAIQFSNDQASPTLNSRSITFTLSDGAAGGLSQSASVNVNIPTNTQPIILNGSGFYIAENTTAVTTISATDPNNRPITFSVSGGDDAAKFSINSITGALRFVTGEDYENPTDVGLNRIYNVTVRATNDQGAFNESALVVNLVDIVDEAAQAAANDTDAPVFGYATVNANTLVMNYNDINQLDAVVGHAPATSAFTVSGNTVTAVAVNAAAKTVTLTLGTAVASGAAVTVAYADPTVGNDAAAIQDANGNDAATLTATAVTNLTAAAPVFGYATVNASTLVMTYTGSNLDAEHPPALSAFAVSGNTVTAVAVNSSAKTVTLTLGTAVAYGAAVTVTYTDPTTGNDVAAIQDATGNDAVTLTAAAVTNLTAAPPSSGGGGGSSGGSSGGSFTPAPTPTPTPPVVTPTPTPSTPTPTPTPSTPTDSDSDGVADSSEGSGARDTDKDGTPDNHDIDDDNDGVDSVIENAAPNPSGTGSGDGNGDGVLDTLQSSVTSLNTGMPDAAGNDRYVTIVNSGTGQQANVIHKPAPGSSELPAELQDQTFPLGVFSFEVTNVTPSADTTISLFVDSDVPVIGYVKQNAVGAWVNVPVTITTVGDKQRVDFVVKDNGPLDSNPALGAITDPGGPVFAKVNSVPTGAITITGTAIQGQTLTVTNTLADADGLGGMTYVWMANGTAITGATAATYTPTQAQVGKTITVAANYTDSAGNAERVVSAATAAIANINDAPTGAVRFSVDADKLISTNTLADADGLGTLNYQWLANGVVIPGATAVTYAFSEAQIGKTITVAVSYIDKLGTAERVVSTDTVVLLSNHAPTGVVTISGSAQQGQTLTAANTLADVDGLGAISYQWLANGTAITGAVGKTFALTAAQIGKTITVAASYTDKLGTAEQVVSTATPAVVKGNTLPTATNGTLTAVEDTAYHFTVANFNFRDADAGDTLAKVQITTLPTKGVLAYSSDGLIWTTVIRNQIITTADIDAGHLRFTPAADDNGVNYVSIGFKVSDGIAFSSAAYTLKLNVTAVAEVGTPYDDTLQGSAHHDEIDGLAGNDVIAGLAGNDTLIGGLGNDTLRGGMGRDSLSGGDGSDTYYIDNTGDKVIETNAAASGGIDRVYSGLTAYTLTANVETGVILGTAAANLTGNTLDNLLIGNGGANILLGNAGNDSLNGGTGNDTLNGGAGNDTLNGGVSSDVLNGGTGKDVFQFSAALIATNVDKIVGFSTIDDRIMLKNAIFKKLDISNELAAEHFHASTTGTAHDSNDFVLYNSKSGALLYDADGSGAEAAIQFAIIGVGLALTATDFVVS